jgi:hypothetical protein
MAPSLALDFGFLNAEYTRVGEPVCMVVPVAPIKGIDGDYLTREGDFVTALQRHTPTDLYCSGIQVLNPARVVALTQGDDSFYSLWGQLIAQQQLRISSVYPNRWFSVDTLAQLASLA